MMNGPAAPESGDTDIPSFEELASDPEIAALLDFEPVPRKVKVAGAWTPDKQREFIARMAVHGSPGPATNEMGKDRTGVQKLYKSPQGESFREAWDGAVELATRRNAERGGIAPVTAGTIPPSLDHRRKYPRADGPQPGQVMNEFGEWEDEQSYAQRGEEAKDSICAKLLRCRRAFLQDISSCPGKRAAFEILTELPVDWEIAARGEPQPFEPWTSTNQREPDMVLTAESGWTAGEFGYVPDRKAEARAAMDAHRAEEGMEPVDWEGGE